MKTSRKKQQHSAPLYVREIGLLLLGAIVIFLSIALCTFNPTDASWFYFSTEGCACSNKAGWAGAHSAALLFYLFGSVSFLFLLFLSFITYCMYKQQSLREVWERLVGFFILIGMSCSFLNFQSIDFFGSPYPGGCVGWWCAHILQCYFDTFGTLLFQGTFFIIAVILITQFSGIFLVQRVLHAMYRGVRCSPLLPAVGKILCRLYMFGLRCTQWLFLAIKQFLQAQYSTDYSYAEVSGIEHDQPLQAMPPQPVAKHDECLQETSEQTDPDVPYQLPTLSPASVESEGVDGGSGQEVKECAKTLEEKLQTFGIYGHVTAIKRGPVVSLFEYQPTIDTKISKIIALEDDLALALRALSIRIIAPIPGKSVVGFEIANKQRAVVRLSTLMQSSSFKKHEGHLPLVLGTDSVGTICIGDLATMPHLLLAGSTGSGKSVALHTMLASLLCKKTPDALRLILIDPKRLEFSIYADIAHLYVPIVTESKKVINVLSWVVREMERRYTLLAQYNARSIADYNMIHHQESIPYIVIVIDELADLMMTTGHIIEQSIARIAQMARAAGIHMIVATQRPSVDVITGMIKVNFPTRISCKVTSKVDSRTILDAPGAEKLLGKGDMLFLDAHDPTVKRIHGAYINDHDIRHIVATIKKQRIVRYQEIDEMEQHMDDSQEDSLHKDVLAFLSTVEEVSISLLQRKFRIGYNRAARIIDTLETKGLILPNDRGKTRKVIK